MSWITSRWRSATVLVLAVAAVAVPAWASSGGGEEATAPPPLDRAQLDRSLQCMADHGYGIGAPTEGGGAVISREQAQSEEFHRAASACELPPPPTDAQIHEMACGDDAARRDDAD